MWVMQTSFSCWGFPGVGGSYCRDVESFGADSVAKENEVLRLVNVARASPRSCGTLGDFRAAPPVTYNARLRCSSRVHAKDMATRGYFDHINPEQETPGARMQKGGYMWSTYGENISAGYPTAKDAVDGWLKSDGHCSNIMKVDFKELGVGYYAPTSPSEFGTYWVQNFGTQYPMTQ